MTTALQGLSECLSDLRGLSLASVINDLHCAIGGRVVLLVEPRLSGARLQVVIDFLLPGAEIPVSRQHP
jgi:hypothetical protein